MTIVFCIFLGISSGIMSSLVIVEALDLEVIFQFILDGIVVNTWCRKVVATITPLTLSTPKTCLLVVFVFFASLTMISKKLLVLATRCVSIRSVSGL